MTSDSFWSSGKSKNLSGGAAGAAATGSPKILDIAWSAMLDSARASAARLAMPLSAAVVGSLLSSTLDNPADSFNRAAASPNSGPIPAGPTSIVAGAPMLVLSNPVAFWPAGAPPVLNASVSLENR